MAGIYIHVPFCAKRCLYCDFYSNTEMSYKEPYLVALQQEMELRKEYLSGETIETIYFGGGTPSQLQAADFSRIFDTINRLFRVSDDSEITLEANPDDLQPAYVGMLQQFPFNRISMGVQSFDDDDLRFLNRRHDSRQAVRAVELCREAGITNLSIDLIYGLPGQTVGRWERNLEAAIRLDVPHLSAYHLIYEEGTALYKLLEAGRVTPVEESVSVDLFTLLIDRLTAAGYLHYEISNFARPGCFSRHNSSYWLGKSYLGLGPSAHSYNQQERMWNVSSLPIYIAGMEQGIPNVEREPLPLETRYNDFIITGLRTMWGIDLEEMERRFGKRLADYCRQEAATYLRRGLLSLKGSVMTLSRAGVFVSDGIMSDLLWVDS
ncbi:MAG: radical SAM family heme chaperone HemW [Bacteroidales bacterium]|nr:radical SAM family heme chaperone HemW [Bacteroidales bacterium]